MRKVVWLGDGVAIVVLFWILVIGQFIFNLFFFATTIIHWIREEHKSIPTQLGINREKEVSALTKIKDETIQIGGQIFLELLLYPTLVVCFEMFSCKSINGESYLARHLEMRCWQGPHTANLIFAILTLATTLPVSLVFASLQNRYLFPLRKV